MQTMPRQTIPSFELLFDQDFRREFSRNCERIFDEAYLTDHTYVRRFEADFAEFSKARFACAVSNGTAAIEAALLAVGVSGKEVLLPTNTFVATAAAIERAGGIPVPLDIENRAFGLDPRELAKRLSSGSAPRPAAIIAVHIGGLISPAIDEIVKICGEYGIPLIEDCAHAHGCSLNGKAAGSFGLAGCFSFFPTKVVTSGEGGMIVTADARFAEKLRSVRRFGRDPANEISHLGSGSNFKMTEFQALLGSLDLARADARIRRRQSNAARYRDRLKGSSWTAISPPEGAVCTHYKQIVLSPLPRAEVERALAAEGLSLTGGVYFIPLHRQPYYRERLDQQTFPVSDTFSDRHICPPCYPELETLDIDRVCDQLLRLSS